MRQRSQRRISSIGDSTPKQQHRTSCYPHAIELLESRTLLATAIVPGTTRSVFDVANIPEHVPSTTDISDVKRGPLANAGQQLTDIYLEYRRYQRAGPAGPFQSRYEESIFFKQTQAGPAVGVIVRARGGINPLTASMRGLKAEFLYRSARTGTVEAFVPITYLRALAGDRQVATITPLFRPTTMRGTSDNQADAALNADKARSSFGLDGSGVKIGVISDSVDVTLNGLPGSVATGDLPAGVQVLSDMPRGFGGTDEGRAMLELIHDIAPGARLAFASAGFSQQQFAQAVRNLRSAGSDVIVDDINFRNEPFFQAGVVEQAITHVTQDGATYFAAAGNAADAAYEAAMNWVTRDGRRVVDFDPGSGVDTRLRLTVTGASDFVFQWDNPYNGVVGNATADVDVYFYAPGTDRIIGAATEANLLTGIPVEMGFLPGSRFDMEIRLFDYTVGEQLPTRFKFYTRGDTLTAEYPGVRGSIIGHQLGPDTIAVGAVSFADAPPFRDLQPGQTINNELFSSHGPGTRIFDAAGNRLPSPLTIQKPDISAIDNVNTSFFTGLDPNISFIPPGFGDILADSDVLPNFPGTSAAAPNAAAVAALIRQAAPNASTAQIRAALQSTAVPLNGGQAGQWDPQGGFGLIDAFAAIRPFVSAPSVRIAKVSPNPTDTAVGTMKIVFSQQISGFDIADLQFRVQGGPNLLTGANTLRTRDGGRTWFLGNLASLNAQPGTYTLTLADTGTPITNLAGLQLTGGASASFTKIAPPPPPAAPRDLSAQVLDSDTIRLRWTDMSDNETSFTLQRAEDADFRLNLVNINLPPNTTVYDDELPAGTTFYYRIRAFNDFSGGSTFSRTVLATTLSPGEAIVDNSSGRATVRGDWSVVPKQDFTFGSNFLSDDNSGKGTKSVRFTPNLLEEGDYYVYTRWTRSADRATNVPIDIYYDDDGHRAKKTLTVDQRNRGGAGWVLLGKFHFAAGTNGFVVIRNDGTDGTVIADAVRFLRAENAR